MFPFYCTIWYSHRLSATCNCRYADFKSITVLAPIVCLHFHMVSLHTSIRSLPLWHDTYVFTSLKFSTCLTLLAGLPPLVTIFYLGLFSSKVPIRLLQSTGPPPLLILHRTLVNTHPVFLFVFFLIRVACLFIQLLIFTKFSTKVLNL